MSVQRLLHAVCLMCASVFAALPAVANPCQTANPGNVSEVYNCLAQSPQATAVVGQAGATPMGCGSVRLIYADALRRAGVNDDSKVPGCRVMAGVLKEFNGKLPIWNQCVDYDGTEQHFRRCMSGEILAQANAQSRGGVSNCPAVLQSYILIVGFIVDTPQSQALMREKLKTQVSCDVVSDVLRQNKLSMYGQECLGYQPDSTAHVSKCIGNDPDIAQRAQGRLDCNTARAIYLQKITMAVGQPANYQIPRCSTLDPVVAAINAKAAH